MGNRGTRRRVALYVRVSTARQHPLIQLACLEREAALRGCGVVDRYVEVGDGHSEHRPEFARLMRDVLRGRVNAVMVVCVDRFFRNVRLGLKYYDELRCGRGDGCGCEFIAVSERGIDTTICDVDDVRFAIIEKLKKAEQERRDIVRRVRAHVQWARENGVRLGRRPRDFDLARAQKLRAEGLSYREISARIGEPRSTVHFRLAQVSKKTPPAGTS